MRLSDGEQRRMELRFAQRCAAAGAEAEKQLARQLAALSPDCALLTKWCFASSPLSDWADDNFSLFRACAEHALCLHRHSPLAKPLPESLFLNYVLHPRVNEEALSDCRRLFYEQLKDRIEGLSAYDAALAVNEWCAEQVCYRSTDERTGSALDTWRSGFGRCGEESTFAVNALRAAGIPARQVYTPRWAHCDDNHAWVEVFCGGAWHFLGACEPEQTLDRGWFTGAASRAVLVHSRCFGTPETDDEVICVDGAVTFLNQTARYARVRTLCVQVLAPDGTPAEGAEVTFGILNESQIFPAAVLRTGHDGTARLRCGYGDLIVQARRDELFCACLCPAAQTEPLTLTLAAAKTPSAQWTDFTIHAPRENSRVQPAPARQAFAAEKTRAADAARRLRTEAAFDPVRAAALCAQYGAEAEPLLRAACGNFDTLAEFLEHPAFSPERKLALLKTLSEKDLRDVRADVLYEALTLAPDLSPSDTFAMRYILCPRVGLEPLAPCRAALLNSFSDAEKQRFRTSPEALWAWIQEKFLPAPEVEYRQLLTRPAGAMRLRRADARSKRLLFVSICRALAIPARLNPAVGAAEYASDGRFRSPEAGLTPDAALCLEKPCGEAWQSGSDFGLSVLESDAWRPLALCDSEWDGNLLTVPLPAGIYRILTSNRLPNGDLRASRLEFSLLTGETKHVRLRKQTVSFAELAVDFTLAGFTAHSPDGRTADAAALTATPSLLMWLNAGSEPTEHLLNELIARRTRISELPLRLVFLPNGPLALQNRTLQTAVEAFPDAEVWFSPDAAEPAARSAYVDPERLPLLLLCDGPCHIVHASAGYRVGSVDTALDFCRTIAGKA